MEKLIILILAKLTDIWIIRYCKYRNQILKLLQLLLYLNNSRPIQSILLDYNNLNRIHKSTQYNVDNTELSFENNILKKFTTQRNDLKTLKKYLKDSSYGFFEGKVNLEEVKNYSLVRRQNIQEELIAFQREFNS